MEIKNSFRVQQPPDATWAVLNDVERIAPCLPGAQLQSIEGDEYRGTATFVERDDTARKAVLQAKGRETRGQGNASAMVTASVVPDGDGTRVDILTDLTITGKAAQFGRGTFSEVSQKLINQFAQQLEQLMSAEPAVAAGTSPSEPVDQPTAESGLGQAASTNATDAPTPSGITSSATGTTGQPTEQPRPQAVRPATPPQEVEAIDLTSLAGPAVAKRAAVAVGVGAILFVLIRRLTRR